ncbi:MAG: hypothetical protein ACLFTE_11815 [Salinivenus sp.]
MRESDIGLIRHYLARSADVPHYGRTVLRPKGTTNSTVFTEQNDSEDEVRTSDTPVKG